MALHRRRRLLLSRHRRPRRLHAQRRRLHARPHGPARLLGEVGTVALAVGAVLGGLGLGGRMAWFYWRGHVASRSLVQRFDASLEAHAGLPAGRPAGTTSGGSRATGAALPPSCPGGTPAGSSGARGLLE
ncbi:MAG: hypothetical protein ACRDYD_09305, partial [Acidimicrobiales bacterium]